MEFEKAIKTINRLLLKKKPLYFNSSWILKYSPESYRFIQKNIRTDFGKIDWDKVTHALDHKLQKLWRPAHKRNSNKTYRDYLEVKLIIKKYKKKQYVFLASQNAEDRRVRDIISISLVRLAQNGNLSAKKKIMELAGHTINDWIYNSHHLSYLTRWQGHEAEAQEQLEACIRRYRYSGSFIKYLSITLERTGMGLTPFYAYSLDKPVAWDVKKSIIENVVADPETGRTKMYDSANYTDFLE